MDDSPLVFVDLEQVGDESASPDEVRWIFSFSLHCRSICMAFSQWEDIERFKTFISTPADQRRDAILTFGAIAPAPRPAPGPLTPNRSFSTRINAPRSIMWVRWSSRLTPSQAIKEHLRDVTSDTAAGKIRLRFGVDRRERLRCRLPPSGRAEGDREWSSAQKYLRFVLYKENKETIEALAILASQLK